jgi:hypothetical protein
VTVTLQYQKVEQRKFMSVQSTQPPIFWKLKGTYVNVQGACILLDCTEGYVRRMLIIKRLDGIKIGREWLIPVVNGKLEVKEKS